MQGVPKKFMANIVKPKKGEGKGEGKGKEFTSGKFFSNLQVGGCFNKNRTSRKLMQKARNREEDVLMMLLTPRSLIRAN